MAAMNSYKIFATGPHVTCECMNQNFKIIKKIQGEREREREINI